MNRLPYDPHNARITSGVRLGTPIVTRNGMGPAEMEIIARLVDGVLAHVEMAGEREYRLPETVGKEAAARVQQLCARFPAW
jgi:glycine hydroxymethyltransferase